jgi:hypothetical protein
LDGADELKKGRDIVTEGGESLKQYSRLRITLSFGSPN